MQEQAEMLPDAGDSNNWFLQAQRLDAERRTQLGTLNYLPPEIRNQIWRYVASDRPGYRYWNPVSPSTIVNFQFVHCHRNGNVVRTSSPEILGNDLCHLQKALGRHAFELEHVYLSMVTLAFNSPECFRNFLSHVQTDSTTRFRFDIHLFNCSEYRRQLKCEDMFKMWRDWPEIMFETMVKVDRDWAEAFERLPANTKSVNFGLGECSRDKRGLLGVMDVLYRKIAKKAPGAATGTTGLMSAACFQTSMVNGLNDTGAIMNRS